MRSFTCSTPKMATTPSNRVTTKETDFLDQDSEIRGQKYCCLSFISPEDLIKRKDLFVFKKFIGSFSSDVSILFDQLGDKLENQEDKDMISALRSRYDYLFSEDALNEEYDLYSKSKSEALESEYYELNDFQTTMRGIKVRGSYETLKEAQNRAELLQKQDRNFNVYVAQVGCWCPWSPNPEDIEDFEYAETEMNTMMKKYKENQTKKDEYFALRKDEMMQKVKMRSGPSQSNGENGSDAPDPSSILASLEMSDPIPIPTTSSSGQGTTIELNRDYN